MGGSGVWLLLTVALAGVFWLVEVVRARIAKRPPSWKVPREREPTPPLARALWGSEWEMPKADPDQRRHALLVGGSMYLGVAVVAVVTVLVAQAEGASNGAEIAAAIIAVVASMLVALVIAAVVELRRR